MLGRRRLLLLVGGAAVAPACGGRALSTASRDAGGDSGGGEGLDGSVADATTDGNSGVDVEATEATSEDTGLGPDTTSDAGPVGDDSGDGTTGETGAIADAAADGSSDVTSGSDDASKQDGNGCPTGSNVLNLPFSQYPQLLQAGGSVQASPSNYADPVCGQSNIIVITTAPGQFVALSSSCTHACCSVSLQGNVLHCPCHGADFDVATGQCTNGRAGQPLQVLQLCSDSTGVYVTL